VPGTRISAAHGTVRPLDPETGAADSIVYPMYHPAAAFRQPALRETLQADIAGLPDALLESRRRRAAKNGAIAVEVAAVAPAPVDSGAPVPVESAVAVESDLPAPVESGVPAAVESGVRELIESTPRVSDGQEERPDPNQMSMF
jgi:hypothetical protein